MEALMVNSLLHIKYPYLMNTTNNIENNIVRPIETARKTKIKVKGCLQNNWQGGRTHYS